MSNEASSHKAFTNNYIVVTGVTTGTHTLALTTIGNTVTDINDFFTATVLEMPY